MTSRFLSSVNGGILISWRAQKEEEEEEKGRGGGSFQEKMMCAALSVFHLSCSWDIHKEMSRSLSIKVGSKEQPCG